MKHWLWVPVLVLSFVLAGPIDDAQRLIDEGNPAQARQMLESGLDRAQWKIERLTLLTSLCTDLEDHEAAVGYGKQLVKLAPQSSPAYLTYAEALRERMSTVGRMRAMWIVGDYKSALQKSLELDPKNLDALEEQIGFLTHAPGIAGGSAKKAMVKIDELKQLDARRGSLMEANLLNEKEDRAGAIRIYESLLAERPDDHRLRVRLGYWLQAESRFEEADRHFAALEGSSEARHNLTALYQRARTRILGKYEQQQAVDWLIEYVERHDAGLRGLPSKSSALWRKGNAMEQLGDVTGARQAYRQALELDPDNDEAKKSLKKLGRG